MTNTSNGLLKNCTNYLLFSTTYMYNKAVTTDFTLLYYLREAIEKCIGCQTAGSPLNSRKVYLINSCELLKHSYVRQALNTDVVVWNNRRWTGRILKIAYEDIRLVLQNNILADLYKNELKIEEPQSSFEKQRLQRLPTHLSAFSTQTKKS